MVKANKKKVKVKPAPVQRVRLSPSKVEAGRRRALFVEAMIVTNGNKYQSAISAGWPPGETAKKAATRLSDDVRVKDELARRRKDVIEAAEENTQLTVEGVLRELRDIVYSDLRTCFDAAGNMLLPKDLPESIARAVCSVKVTVDKEGDRIKEIKFWDKGSNIERAMKYLGLFKADNAQRGDAAIRALFDAVGEQGAGFIVKP